jgi:DNA-binding NtrC family response regulator
MVGHIQIIQLFNSKFLRFIRIVLEEFVFFWDRRKPLCYTEHASEKKLETSMTCPTILFIEHNDALREMFVRELSRHFTVIAARPSDAQEQIKQERGASAILIGLDMPGQAGERFLAGLLDSFGSQPVPIVAYSSSDLLDKGVKQALAQFFVIPVLPRTLVDSVARVISSYTAVISNPTVEGEIE